MRAVAPKVLVLLVWPQRTERWLRRYGLYSMQCQSLAGMTCVGHASKLLPPETSGCSNHAPTWPLPSSKHQLKATTHLRVLPGRMRRFCMMAACTAGVAVAVSASRGTPGSSLLSPPS